VAPASVPVALPASPGSAGILAGGLLLALLALCAAAPAVWGQPTTPASAQPVRMTISMVAGQTPAELWAANLTPGMSMSVSEGGIVVQTMPFSHLVPWCPAGSTSATGPGGAAAPTPGAGPELPVGPALNDSFTQTYPPGPATVSRWSAGEMLPGESVTLGIEETGPGPRFYLEPQGDDTYKKIELADTEGYTVAAHLTRIEKGYAVELTLTHSALEGGEVDPSIGARVGQPVLVKTTCTAVVPVDIYAATAVSWRPDGALTPGAMPTMNPDFRLLVPPAAGPMPPPGVATPPGPALVVVLRTPKAEEGPIRMSFSVPEPLPPTVAPTPPPTAPAAPSKPGAPTSTAPIAPPAQPAVPAAGGAPRLPSVAVPIVPRAPGAPMLPSVGVEAPGGQTVIVPLEPAVRFRLEVGALVVLVGSPEWEAINAADDMAVEARRICCRIRGQSDGTDGIPDTLQLPRMITQTATPDELEVEPIRAEGVPAGTYREPIRVRLMPMFGANRETIVATECSVPTLTRQVLAGGRDARRSGPTAGSQTLTCHLALEERKPALLRGLCALVPAQGDWTARPLTLQAIETFIFIEMAIIPPDAQWALPAAPPTAEVAPPLRPATGR